MTVPSDPKALARLVLSGDRRALARAISVVENDRPGADDLIAELYPQAGSARIVGVTGSPGVGKSTFVDRSIGHLRQNDLTLAVLAVDPSSPFTGGALLGDRVRMQAHASDQQVFIRSMSSRGHLGGLAVASARVLVVLDAAGFDPILVETVGVGQSEVEIVQAADTSIVILAPGWGDGIQAAKAGILEIGDVFVVNKADLPGADTVVSEMTHMLWMGSDRPWNPPVLKCSSSTGEGISEVWNAVEEHQAYLVASGEGQERRRQRLAGEVKRAVAARFGARVHRDGLDPDLMESVLAGELDPWAAAREVVP